MSVSYEDVLKSKNILPFQFDHLTHQMIEIAEEELNENERTRISSIEQLRKLVLKDQKLKCRTDDEFLLQFLRARKFNVKSAFARLQSFYKTTSKTFADTFANMEVENVKKAYGTGFGSILPYRDREGAAVVLFRANNWNVEEFDVFSMFNFSFALLLRSVDSPASQVCGVQILVDAKGMKLQHVRCFTPRLLKLSAKVFQDVLPVRFKGIHLINCSTLFQYFWSLITFFLSEKIRKRVHSHNANMESLHKFIPKEILPTEYRGDNSHFDPIQHGSIEVEKFLPKYLQIIRDGYKNN